MKKVSAVQEKPSARRKSILVAVVWLLISAILLTGVSYAWLIMSVAPEVIGISTNIGSNGSLEMALLNSKTYEDLEAIQTIVGTTLIQDKTEANVTWGNLVDLNDESYGLNHISLLPTRLNYENGRVDPANLLKIPTYAYDGRIINLENKAYTSLYDPAKSSFSKSGYGVRAIGTSQSLTAQGSALLAAKSSIATYTSGARTETIRVLKDNIDALMGLVLAYSTNSNATYDDEDVQILENLIESLKNSTANIELALRQGLMAFAASAIEDEDQFETIRSAINTLDLSILLMQAELSGIDVPAQFETWVREYKDIANDLNQAGNACGDLTGGVYTWADLRGILNYVMNLNKVYFGTTDANAKPFADMTAADFTAMMGQDIEMTLAPGSGVIAKVADFTGNMSADVKTMGMEITIETLSAGPFYLVVLKDTVDPLPAAGGSVVSSDVKLDAIYGYVIDLAFRCNAAFSDLLLQTEAKSRVDNDDTGASTMGSGSYMEFSTTDNNFAASKMVELMDAIRITFIDHSGNILGVAKLNTSNYQNNDGVIKASLYLYNYEFSNESAIAMGERRKGDNVITALPQNEIVAVSAVVWLDGDVVNNTMVSAEEETSLNGVLNLQFASSADLVPAENAELFNAEPSKATLQSYIDQYKDTYENGQKTYTTDSWVAFAADYQYAKVVLENSKSTEAEVYRAQTNLPLSGRALKEYSFDELKSLIADVRDMMGQTEEVARYVMQNGNVYYGVTEYTEETKGQRIGEIFSVDFATNLEDKGNGVLAPIWSEESWTKLASALYEAEIAVFQDEKIPALDNSALENAYDALTAAFDGLAPYVYYKSYFYDDQIYYFADTTDEDTYGKWYYYDRTMVVADLLIIKLDAKKEAVDVASLKFDERYKVVGDKVYVAHNEKGIVPYVELLKKAYPELSDDDILAIQWSIPEAFVQLMTASQEQALNQLIQAAEEIGITAENAALQKALDVLGDSNTAALDRATAAEANKAIDDLIIAINTEKETQIEPPIDPETASITTNQITVLEIAIAQAKLVDNYHNPDEVSDEEAKAKLQALIEATENAEAALLAADTTTMAKADELLEALNDQLVAHGITEVTEYNTIKYQLYPLPNGYFDYDYGYTINHEMPVLNVATTEDPAKDITGEYTISATVYTKQGVVCIIEKTICIYAPAEDVEVRNENNEVIDEFNIEVDQAQSVTLSFIHATYRDGSPIDDMDFQFNIGDENISDCTWASEDTEIVTVSGKNGCCTITAVAPGTTRVTVTVTSEYGTKRVLALQVTVPQA